MYRGFIYPSILQTLDSKGYALDSPQNAQLVGAHKTVTEYTKGYCSFPSLLLQPQTWGIEAFSESGVVFCTVQWRQSSPAHPNFTEQALG